jgi:hypothetical protein
MDAVTLKWNHGKGYFPFAESHVNFSYKYVYRFTEWKIVGINIHVKPVDH